MREYSGYETSVNGELRDDLKRTKNANTLYVSHYYFALNDGQFLIFYYNPQHFWDKIPIEKVEDYVWENLKQECVIFENFDPNNEFESQRIANKVECPTFFPETPKIGNHYSSLGNRIISVDNYFFFLGNFGGCVKCGVKDLRIKDISELLNWAVVTNTPNLIQSIYTLDCFKKTNTAFDEEDLGNPFLG